jgi:putative hemolysin
MKNTIFAITCLFAVLFLVSCEYRANDKKDTQIANPASVYCIEHAGRLEIRTDETGGQYGVCIFSDNSECEEWAYFRGECGKNNAADSCSTDSDCVPSGCCHPKDCVLKKNAPVCEGVMCTMNCAPGTLDCGQGKCSCVNGKCEAILN